MNIKKIHTLTTFNQLHYVSFFNVFNTKTSVDNWNQMLEKIFFVVCRIKETKTLENFLPICLK
jgi:hypothetical protein